jgi:hypothetical protein
MIREAARAAAKERSIRKLAAEMKISPAGLRYFLGGVVRRTSILRRSCGGGTSCTGRAAGRTPRRRACLDSPRCWSCCHPLHVRLPARTWSGDCVERGRSSGRCCRKGLRRPLKRAPMPFPAHRSRGGGAARCVGPSAGHHFIWGYRRRSPPRRSLPMVGVFPFILVGIESGIGCAVKPGVFASMVRLSLPKHQAFTTVYGTAADSSADSA